MDAAEVFLGRRCQALFPDDAGRAKDHLAELLTALRRRADIRRLCGASRSLSRRSAIGGR